MRLHHLKIEAFGPFGGIAEVDFDELNAAGQFLISGATGSGKTFILDAVCFALYGEVPGERQRAKHLRSDHASPGAEPRVTLTLTVAERVIRISRSPAWNRPKRRGEGTTLQQASVRLEQQVDDEWLVLATRLDEAGHLINTWLGMTPTQFTQVALLPQGGFQTFLHSPTAARQAILQRLFRTDRFERVEKWFGEFRRSLNRSRQEALHSIDVIAHRLSEAARGTEPPRAQDDVEAIAAWATEQRAASEAQREAAVETHADAVLAHTQAAVNLAAATALAATLDRAAQAQQQLRELDTSADEFNDRLALLQAHQRAHHLLPLLHAHASAALIADEAGQHANAALEGAGVGDLGQGDLDVLVERAKADIRVAEHALVLSEKLHTLRTHAADAERYREKATLELAELRLTTEKLPAELERVTQQVREANEAEVQNATVGAALAAARAELSAALDLRRVGEELAEKVESRVAEQTRVHDLREAYQNAREERIAAMASELAGALVVGCSCPVCGSTSHPTPATGAGGIGRKHEERARRSYESANVELNALDEVIAGLKARAEALVRASGGEPVEVLTTRVADLQEHQDALGAVVKAAPALHNLEADIRRRLSLAHADTEQAVQHETRMRAEATHAAALVDECIADLNSTLGEHADAPTFAGLARRQSEYLTKALAAVRAFDEAQSLAAQQLLALDAQAAELGFDSGSQAEAAILAPNVADQIADQERQRDRVRLAATAVLEDPDVAISLQSPRPDLEAIRLIATSSEDALAQAQAALRVSEGRAQRTRVIGEELAKALAAYVPLAAKADQVTSLSGLLEGTSADNRLRMRLSAFVLAERLRQVIAAANARLEVISEGRYVLSYQEERGAGDSRGGLSLSVLDEWTGIRRDPTTLSGGETFVVSLCLALGLADTVADESGGLRIDTLFIDEGFGSLDAQTLDSVIDILSQLSQGGRVTGVVSHVQELRERLPAILEVVGSKSGSTVRRASA